MRLTLIIFFTLFGPLAEASWRGYDFTQLSKDIPKEYQKYVKVGKSLFNKPWVEAPSSTIRRDGLGPLFNATSCASCHPGNSKGLPTMKSGKIHPSLLFRVKKIDTNTDHPTYGGQLQINAIQNVIPEVKVSVTYNEILVQYPDGETAILNSPSYKFHGYSKQQITNDYKFSARLAPHLGGLGKLDQISDKQLIDHSISKKRPVPRNKSGKISRFGLQSESQSLESQTAAAFRNDMGITSHLQKNETCTQYQLDCLINDMSEDLDIRDDHLKYVIDFVSHIIVPKKKILNSHGKKQFIKVGCTNCHNNPYVDKKNNEISAYTDLMTYDLGDGLADRDFSGKTVKTFWRTAPLWGISRLRNKVFLHDGRAKSIEEAILWHKGEASKQTENFMKLSQKERESLINFVENL